MSTERCIKWAQSACNFWEEAEDNSISPNVVVSYSSRTQTGEGFEELINALNSETCRKKIKHVHIWDTSYGYRYTIPEFEIYEDTSIVTKWVLANQQAISKLNMPFTVHHWKEGLDAPEFEGWIKKIKIAFGGDEKGSGIIPEFRALVLSEGEKAVVKGIGTLGQNIGYILEETAFTCLHFQNGVIVYPTKISAPIAYAMEYYNIPFQNLPYRISNYLERHTHRSWDRNEVNHAIIQFMNQFAKNVNLFVIGKNGDIIYKNESLKSIVSESDATKLAPMTWKNNLEVMQKGAPITVEEEDKGKNFLSIKAPLIINEQIEGVIGLAVDITDRKKMEIERKKVAELEALNKMQQVKIAVQQEFTEFISRMAHDIASPLASLEMFMKSYRNFSDKQDEILKNIITDIRTIADDLLHKNRISMKVFDSLGDGGILIATAVKDAINQKKLQYGSKADIRLFIEPAAEFVFIKVNSSDFNRMISNFINNAVEACSHNECIIDVRVKIVENKVVIEIEDNGEGLTSEMVSQISQQLPVKSTKETGFGLGLSQVIDTLKKYKGTLDVSSTSNEGTRFIVTFPAERVPEWIIENFEFPENSRVVVIGKNINISDQLLSDKFKDFEFKCFMNNTQKAVEFLSSLSIKEAARTFIIIDDKIINNLSELEIADIQKNFTDKIIIISSHPNDLEVQNMARYRGSKIMPRCFWEKFLECSSI